jgi:hypothetical protein
MITAGPAAGVILRNLNQHDAHPVRVCDPHLHQSPRLLLRFAYHRHPGCQQTLELHVADLNPDRQGIPRRIGRPSTDLEKGRSPPLVRLSSRAHS